MTKMAILQEVDKCMKCHGCVVACKREWNLRRDSIGDMSISVDQRLAIKSQKRVEMGPYVRFSCWHCPDPPCARACPTGAMKKQANGAVAIDNSLCTPDTCKDSTGRYPCQVHCQRGGYPKIGKAYIGSDVEVANKCTLCYGRAGSDADVAASGLPGLPTRKVEDGTTRTFFSQLNPAAAPIAELAHEPACVSSCPAKAMHWDTQANIIGYLSNAANGYTNVNGKGRNWFGGESMFWASKKVLLAPPKADPLIEDHVAPLVGDIAASSMKVALPTLVVGGLMALSARRARVQEEALAGRGEV